MIKISNPNSNSIRFKKALLGLPVEEKIIRKITIQDVIDKWCLLYRSGYSPVDVFHIANEEDIDDNVFKKLMISLNGYL